MYTGIQTILTRLSYLCVVLLILAYLRKDSLPDHTQILPAIHAQPIQRTISAAPFLVDYKGQKYQVQPRATYDLKGLVVSQNNPTSIADIYHDSKSLDTKDFCVIWGHNVKSNEFKQVKYWSGAWTCYCEWKDAGLRFWMNELSNNHLITDSDEIRAKIAKVGIGDQVHIKGMLVDYKNLGPQGGGRKSSLVRTDTGNGACESIFVQELKVLRSSNQLWRDLYKTAAIGLALLLMSKALLHFTIGTRHLTPNR